MYSASHQAQLEQMRGDYILFPFRMVVMFGIVLILFVIGSSIVYALIEDWTLTDALYFSIVSISTVGYGDIVPDTTAGRIANLVFTFMSFCGIFMIGRVIVGYVVDRQIELIIKRIKKKREQKQAAIPMWRSIAKEQTDLAKLADDAAEEIEEEKDEQMTSGRDIRMYLHTAIYCIWLLVWTLFYSLHKPEDLNVFEAIYFGVITSTTIGYGHYIPVTTAGKWLCIVLTLFGVISLSILATTTSRGLLAIIAKFKCARKKEDPSVKTPKQAQMEKLETLLDLVKKGERQVNEAEFLCAMLVAGKVVKQEEMDRLSKEFHDLDADGNGVLNEKDFIEYKQRTMLGDADTAGLDYKLSNEKIAMTRMDADTEEDDKAKLMTNAESPSVGLET